MRKDRDVRLKAILMEAGLRPASELNLSESCGVFWHLCRALPQHSVLPSTVLHTWCRGRNIRNSAQRGHSLVPKRDKQGGIGIVRSASSHSSSPKPLMAPQTPVQDTPPTPRNGRGPRWLLAPSTPEAFQVAKDLLSLLILPTSQGPLLARATRVRREQGLVNSVPVPTTAAPFRGKPSMVPLHQSLSQH